MPAGRPSDYTKELGDKICGQIVLGCSIKKICEPEDMPCPATIFNWFRNFPEFLDNYEKSKQIQADTLAEELLDIADDGSNDWMERNTPSNPGWMANGEHIQRSRLRVDTRKWIASKLKPKKYGDKVEHSGTGADGQIIVQVVRQNAPDNSSSE